MSLDELKQDPFDADEFIERLAWRVNQDNLVGSRAGSGGRLPSAGDGGGAALTDFSPMLLHGAFCEQIEQLKNHERNLERSAQHLEQQCIDEEKAHWRRVKDLQRRNQSAFQTFQELDERINYVATKVVHLGDQLESINLPRQRNAEALHLMKYLDRFLDADSRPSEDSIFTDRSQLPGAADLVQKLHAIAQELPSDSGPFRRARECIMDTYNKVEQQVKDGFTGAHFHGDIPEMKKMCDLLVNFQTAYTEVVDGFIEESQRSAFIKGDIFEDVLATCVQAAGVIRQVFGDYETVMTKYVNVLYTGKLKDYIAKKLPDRTKREQYLKVLYELYDKTVKLSTELAEKVRLGSDTSFLVKLTNKNLFGDYLATYVKDEECHLKDKCAALLQGYYDRCGHVKKHLQSGGIHEFRRDLQVKMNIHLGSTPAEGSSGSGDAYIPLSQEVAISILQEFKVAYKRCVLLANKLEVADCVKGFFDQLIQYLCVDFIDYAIDLGLLACPLPEPRSEPSLHFLATAADASAIVHLLEKQFSDSIWPIVSLSPDVQKHCLTVKQQKIDQIEQKVDQGLERTLQATSGYVKYLLTSEQKKTDFKPEGPLPEMKHSQACDRVVKYMVTTIARFKDQLDGKNLDVTLTEFGVRVHKIIYDHLIAFQYSSMGAMFVICDINEYRSCIKELNSPLVTKLFDVLHSLCSLLVVPADGVRSMCSSDRDTLGTLDRSIIMAFLQQRVDYKTAKLAGVLAPVR